MTGEIVARSTSKWGGKCAHCRGRIPRGGVIVKVASEGDTTRHGQGPGFWVGLCCVKQFEKQPTPTLFGEEDG